MIYQRCLIVNDDGLFHTTALKWLPVKYAHVGVVVTFGDFQAQWTVLALCDNIGVVEIETCRLASERGAVA